jgi:drug/metabolite transporter (DMT)-like permease
VTTPAQSPDAPDLGPVPLEAAPAHEVLGAPADARPVEAKVAAEPVGGGAQRTATLMLAIACAAWGVSFVFIKVVDQVLARDLTGPPWLAALWVVAVRFLVAGALLLPLPAVRRGFDAGLWRDAGLLALPSVLGYALQVAGMRGLDPGANAFLTSLYTPLTPILAWLLLRKVPERRVLLAVPVAVAGIWLLAGMTEIGFSLHVLLVVLADVCWALQILGIDRWARKHPPGAFSCALFLWIGLGGLVLLGGGLLVAGDAAPAASVLLKPLADPGLVPNLLGLVVVSTIGAMVLINAWQPSLDPSRAALLYTLEPVFAALFSVAVTAERFDGWKLAGCGVLLGANLVVEAPAIRAVVGRRLARTAAGS